MYSAAVLLCVVYRVTSGFYCDGVTQFEKISAALLRLYDYDCRSQPWRFAAKM